MKLNTECYCDLFLYIVFAEYTHKKNEMGTDTPTMIFVDIIVIVVGICAIHSVKKVLRCSINILNVYIQASHASLDISVGRGLQASQHHVPFGVAVIQESTQPDLLQQARPAQQAL